MEGNIFINQAFTNAINLYLENKQSSESTTFSTFPVTVIRTLIFIYGELDIINPFRTNNEDRMGGFDSNITKFGFSKRSLTDFKDSFQKCFETNIIPNVYFLKVEKYLIDMFFYRKKAMGSTEEQISSFQTFLYLSTNQNESMKKEAAKYINSFQELDLYFNSKKFESNHNFVLLPYKENTLLPEAYTTLGYTLEMIAQLDDKTLSQLNNKILNFFKIDSNESEKNERLKEAISYYKRYGNSITTGNGYVDMLLLLSVIATVMMTLFAITVRVLG
ncbi:MAG: hypothetical protein HFI09_02910 [Bacilli bacterium]|nr:hypothetical protein [Bacilli bacterium]